MLSTGVQCAIRRRWYSTHPGRGCGRGLAAAGRARPAPPKKALHAAERDTPRIVALRGAFVEAVVPTRFKFVDETGLHLAFTRRYGRAPGGQRVGQVPRRVDGLTAVMSLDEALNRHRFAAYSEHVLSPGAWRGGRAESFAGPPRGRHGRTGRGPRGSPAVPAPVFARFCAHRTAWSKLKTMLRGAQARAQQALE